MAGAVVTRCPDGGRRTSSISSSRARRRQGRMVVDLNDVGAGHHRVEASVEDAGGTGAPSTKGRSRSCPTRRGGSSTRRAWSGSRIRLVTGLDSCSTGSARAERDPHRVVRAQAPEPGERDLSARSAGDGAADDRRTGRIRGNGRRPGARREVEYVASGGVPDDVGVGRHLVRARSRPVPFAAVRVRGGFGGDVGRVQQRDRGRHPAEGGPGAVAASAADWAAGAVLRARARARAGDERRDADAAGGNVPVEVDHVPCASHRGRRAVPGVVSVHQHARARPVPVPGRRPPPSKPPVRAWDEPVGVGAGAGLEGGADRGARRSEFR